MKILIDLTSLYFHLSGIERYAANISEQMLMAHPEDNYVLLFANEIHPLFLRYESCDNVQMITVPCGNRLWFAQVRLPGVLKKIRADVYYFPAFCAPWLFSRPNTVDVIHDLSDFECCEGKGRLKTLYCRLGIYHARRCAAKLITVSEFSKGRICRILQVPEEKITVAYDGVARTEEEEKVSWEAVREKYRLPKRYLLTVSTLEPRKNLRLLLEAFEQYCREEDQAGQPCGKEDTLKLVLCGRAGWNLKKTLGEGERDAGRILVTGFVDDGELPAIYAHAEAFVFPSRYEGFGLPPLEAMARNCIVVSSDAAAMPEILGDAPIYFESGNKISLLEALRKITVLDEVKKAELRSKGRQRVEMFSWQKEAEKTHAVFVQMTR